MIALTNPWTYVIAVLVFIAGFGSGIKVESDHRDARELVAVTAMHDAYVAGAKRLREAADAVSERLNQSETQRKNDRQTYERLVKEASNANNLSKVQCPAVGAAADVQPVVLLNVGVWNAALQIGSAAGGNPRSTDDGTAGAGFAAVGEAYANLGENAERWAFCRAQVKGWQDLARRNGWVKEGGK